MRVEGRILHRGAPQPDCQVLVCDEGARTVLAAAGTGRTGAGRRRSRPARRTSCSCSAAAAARRSAWSTPASARGGPPLELELTAVAPTHELTVVLAGVPDTLTPQIRLTPRRIGSLDPALLRWVHAPVEEARSSALAGFTPGDRRLRRWVQAGVWWITAQLLIESAGQVPGQALPDSWLPVAAHTDDGRELAPVRGGFELEVAGPVTVTVRLAPSRTETLD